ncbi:SDR family NAD(P)-dependent oxidoreductase [Nocardia terpenica]|nr:SDR family NAD(P)-dependent oxidoreductase [Nocardia terpenica]
MPTVVIIGGSRGLGRGLIREHLRRGWDVIATERHPPDEPISEPRLRLENLDTTDLAGIDALAERLPRQIERLFVVAGIAGPTEAIGQVSAAEFGQTLLVNTLAPLRIADRFADRLTTTGTLAVMSSQQGSITLNNDAGNETYRISKAGLNMGLASIAARRGDQRTYLAINPGWVRTAIGTEHAHLSIEESVPHVVDVLDSRQGQDGIAFLDYDNSPLPW